MSWNPFKSKEVTQVATSVSRVVEDDSLPNAVQSGLVKAIFQNGNIPDYTMEELVNSLGVRAERMYRYGEASYTHGLPSGEVFSSTQGRTEVETLIETLEGQQVFMQYSHYGSLNALHVAWTKLLASHEYNPATNLLGTLSAQKNKQVYLKDMVVVVPTGLQGAIDSTRTAQWGTAPNAGYSPSRPANAPGIASLSQPAPVHYTNQGSAIYVRVTAEWQAGLQVLEESFNLGMSGFNETANYFHAKYVVDGQTKYWAYENDTGTYPTLDAVYTDAPAVAGSYFPFIYFRFNKASTSSDKNSQSYKTSKKMLKILGMDFDLLAESIDENPDITDIEQAMMTFAVPPVSSHPIENRYLFDYFDNMHAALGGGTSDQLASIAAKLSNSSVSHAAVIKDAQFKMVLGNAGIYKRLVVGSIGSVGTYQSSYAQEEVREPYIDFETGTPGENAVQSKVHKYRHQITRNVYEELLVKNLTMTYYIYGGHNTVGDETDSILLIPIDRTVSENYTIAERETLYARSLHFVFNSRTVTKVKWYQQEWFRSVLIVVAIVLTVMDAGTDGGSWIASALELTGTEAIIATVIINLVVGIIILPKIFTLFVKVFGKDVGESLTLLALSYAGYLMVQSSSITGAPFAKDLLVMSSGLNSAVIQAKMSDLLGQQDQLNLYIEDQTKLLDKANELLENSHVLDPFIIFGEKPEDYYNRTVHLGNIGTLGINAISSYVDIALTLPKLNDTLGEELNDSTV